MTAGSPPAGYIVPPAMQDLIDATRNRVCTSRPDCPSPVHHDDCATGPQHGGPARPSHRPAKGDADASSRAAGVHVPTAHPARTSRSKVVRVLRCLAWVGDTVLGRPTIPPQPRWRR